MVLRNSNALRQVLGDRPKALDLRVQPVALDVIQRGCFGRGCHRAVSAGANRPSHTAVLIKAVHRAAATQKHD
jgi:hypothetical protein